MIPESVEPVVPTPVFFVAGGTGISAETLGNLMLQQFPSVSFVRRKIPFITTVEQARAGRRRARRCHDRVRRSRWCSRRCPTRRSARRCRRPSAAFIDLFGSHLDTVERVLHVNATHGVGALHGVGDTRRYDRRMKAIEFAMEHDDGASLRNLEQADLILVAPSRCGKTPTSMYLALQHGLKVANYPLVPEDFDADGYRAPSRTRRQVLRPALHARPAQPGEGGAPTRVDLCEPRPVQPRAAPGRGALSCTPDPVDQLGLDVGGGDGDRHHADQSPGQPRLGLTSTTTTAPASDRHRPRKASPDRATSSWFDDLGLGDVERVGGKNASLGEMVQHLSKAGVRVPDGFATTADAYRRFLAHEGLADRINCDAGRPRRRGHPGARRRRRRDPRPRSRGSPSRPTSRTRSARRTSSSSLGDLRRGRELGRALECDGRGPARRVSFAGQQETFLNVRGIDNILLAIKRVFASLYNDRAIAYRVHSNFDHEVVALSAGIQRMVRSDIGSSGVMFTIDTESGFPDAVFITSSYGLGEAVVQGAVNPDEFYVYKPALRAGRPRHPQARRRRQGHQDGLHAGRRGRPLDRLRRRRPGRPGALSLTDDEVTELAQHALQHRGALRPPDGHRVGQGRCRRSALHPAGSPETVKSRQSGSTLRRFRMDERGPVLVEGRAIGQKIGAGAVRVLAFGRRHARLPGGRGARRRHDRPRLGAGDEARQRHRHQPRRTHLPRRDHRPRARHPRRRRHAARPPATSPTAARSPSPAPRATRAWSTTGCASSRCPRPTLDDMPDVAGQDHDEHRHPGAGVRVLAPAAQGNRARAARVHHQPSDRHPPPRAARARGPGARDQGRDRGAHRGLRLLRATSSSSASPRASPCSRPPSRRSR